MADDIVFLDELFFLCFGKNIPRSSSIGELSATASAFGIELVGPKERVTGTTWIETAVNVKDPISAACIVSRTSRLDYRSIVLQVRHIEQLVVWKTVLAASREVWLDVI